MRSILCLVGLLAAVATTASATTPLVAMRVELIADPATGTAVLEIQVAPEDRDRAGRQVWLEARLEDGGAVVGRLDRAVELDRDGLARLDTPWPAGSYELRVDLESGDRRHSGFWRGRVTIPEPPRAEPVSPAQPRAEAPAPPPPSPAPSTAPRLETPSAATVEAAAAPEAAPPPAAAPDEPPPPAPTLSPAPAAPSPWAATADDHRELTAIVTAAGRAVPDLAAADLELEIDGRRRGITALGDGASAPLELTVVVDLSPSSAPELGAIAGEIARLAARTGGGRGHVRVLGSGSTLEPLPWQDTPARVAEVVESAGTSATGDLARPLREALTGVAVRPGRRLVVVVTDGRHDSDRESWRAAAEAAERAGAPVLVAGLWSADFDHGVRRRLRDLAEAAGGRLFLAQGASGLAGTLEDYGLLADATVALRVAPASGNVRLRSTRRDLEVRHPETLR